jgi:drug/metabolite transporter (DMT)-like permease
VPHPPMAMLLIGTDYATSPLWQVPYLTRMPAFPIMPPMANIGALAALATAFSWTITALAFEYAAKRIGALTLNLLRLVVGCLFLGLWGLVTKGSFIPVGAPVSAWLWLSASGLVGLVLGDLLLFQAFIDVGSRLSMLIYASAPAFTAVLGFAILGEKLGLVAIAGMGLTLAGIALVIITAPRKEKIQEGKNKLRGIFLAFGGAVGQAGGLILSKIGAGHMDPFAGTQIRVMAGIAGFAVIVVILRAWRGVAVAMKDGKAVASLSLGSFFGPFLGVSLSLLAVQSTSAGIAASIMSIMPILIIIPYAILYKERIRLLEVGGAIVAVAGVFLLFAS